MNVLELQSMLVDNQPKHSTGTTGRILKKPNMEKEDAIKFKTTRFSKVESKQGKPVSRNLKTRQFNSEDLKYVLL